MNKYLNNTSTKIGILATIIFGIIYYNNDYMQYKSRNCIVMDKLIKKAGFKSSENLYLVLKEERGIVFDLIVSPATFSKCETRDKIYFNLRQFDIKQTPMDNAIYFFGSVIFGVVGFVSLIGGWVSLKFSANNDN